VKALLAALFLSAGDISLPDGKTDASVEIRIASGQTSTISFTAPAGPIELTVLCPIPANPDVAGTQFKVSSAALGLAATSAPTSAAFWQWSGDTTPGAVKLELTGTRGTSTCKVRLRRLAASDCTDSFAARSPETGHTHVAVGTRVGTGAFPSSGNHWGAWAPWNRIYTRPVKRGFYLHNLEHGGLVLSYKCSAATESAACGEAAANLEALKAAFGKERVIVTPDPDQPTMYGVRSWRTGYRASCYDEERMLDFMTSFFGRGREDTGANPPVLYDPTTTNVPCEDLFAAPDSCR
jgi:hypothetical protein